MKQSNDIDVRKEYLTKFSAKFPEVKIHIIKRVIDEFNCDHDKINDSLVMHSYQESKSISKKSSEASNPSPGIYSFGSFNSDYAESDSSSPAHRNNYKNSTELNTISTQNCYLKRLEDAFKGMEINRDYLTKEMEYLKELSTLRKSMPNFPNINELEKLERLVNKRYAMPPKSISYAGDLRGPDEMNARFIGFRPPYNSNSKALLDNNNDNNHRRSLGNPAIPDTPNPNFYISPKPKNHFLSPLKKTEEKRNSAHFPEDFQLPEEFSGHKRSHSRQKSDPWVLEIWNCPQCMVKNTSSICSFCLYNRGQSDRF